MDTASYLQQHEEKDMLRFLTCGSVDDGKSTLIGRLLFDTRSVLEDQLDALRNESRKYGTAGEELDLALLVDGLQSEREQGITIDVAYRFFATEKRKFIIADTPGHEQYTRNMVTGASTADAAVILVDAGKGITTQTKRHSYLVALLGIRSLVVAVNKMDLVGYDQAVFDAIVHDYRTLADSLGIGRMDFIPVSALRGDNIVFKSDAMPWYESVPLLSLLETLPSGENGAVDAFRFPVQYVNRPNASFRGYCGTVASGRVQRGDRIAVLPSGMTTSVEAIIDASAVSEQERRSESNAASAGMAVTLVLSDEVDISRGDMLVHADALPEPTDRFDADLVWMDETPMQPGKTYDFQHAALLCGGEIDTIHYQVDVNDHRHMEAERAEKNAIVSCRVTLDRPVVCTPYDACRESGSFIVMDRITNQTVGAGMIRTLHSKAAQPADAPAGFEAELNALIRKYFPRWECKHP